MQVVFELRCAKTLFTFAKNLLQIPNLGSSTASPGNVELPSEWKFIGAEPHSRNEDSIMFHYEVTSSLNDITAVPENINRHAIEGLLTYWFNVNQSTVMTKGAV